MWLFSSIRMFVFIFFGIWNIDFFGTNLNTGIKNVGATKFECSSDSLALKAILRRYRSKFVFEGIPEINAPPLEPFNIKNINFETRNPQIGIFNLNLTNLTVRNVSTFEINSACMFFMSRRLVMNFSVPVIFASGHYNLSGVMDNLSPGKRVDLSGSGPLKFALHNVQVYVNLVIGYGKVVHLKEFDFEFSLESVQSNLDNLMGEQHVSFIMNQVVNDIFPEAIRVLKPEIAPPIQSFLEKGINNILRHVTFLKLFSFLGKIAAAS